MAPFPVISVWPCTFILFPLNVYVNGKCLYLPPPPPYNCDIDFLMVAMDETNNYIEPPSYYEEYK